MMTVDEYLQPLRGQIANALWDFLKEEAGTRATRAAIWDEDVDAAKIVWRLVEWLQEQESLTEREWNTLRRYMDSA